MTAASNPPSPPSRRQNLVAMLKWQLSQGVDEAIADAPQARKASKKPTPKTSSPASSRKTSSSSNVALNVTLAVSDFIAEAERLSSNAKTLDELSAAVESFDGCNALKRHATQTVFFDGNTAAKLMIIGEAPGAEEDRLGKPFVGVSGKLLDNALSAIGINGREDYFISNTVFWRPPGNRTPSDAEVSMCLPFVKRLIGIARPNVVLLLGASAVKCLFGKKVGSITSFRRKWHVIDIGAPSSLHDTPQAQRQLTVPTIATFHPAFYLRAPSRKVDFWDDLLMLEEKLHTLSGQQL